jgi:hypothetical protein
VGVAVEVLASARLESSGQRENISLCRIVMTVTFKNIAFLSNL